MPCRIFVWPPFFHDSLPALVTFINPQLRMKIKLGNRSHKAQWTAAVAASRRRVDRLNGCEDGYRAMPAERARYSSVAATVSSFRKTLNFLTRSGMISIYCGPVLPRTTSELQVTSLMLDAASRIARHIGGIRYFGRAKY